MTLCCVAHVDREKHPLGWKDVNVIDHESCKSISADLETLYALLIRNGYVR